MNFVLSRGGYPPIAVRPEDPPAYILALLVDPPAFVDRLLYERLDATLDDYRKAFTRRVAAHCQVDPP
jgi:hypothetical protein